MVQKSLSKQENKLRLANRDMKIQYEQLKFNKKNEDQLEKHFSHPSKEILKKKVQLVSEKAPSIETKKLTKDFSYAFEEESEDENVLNTE
jgi:hypothetical protein